MNKLNFRKHVTIRKIGTTTLATSQFAKDYNIKKKRDEVKIEVVELSQEEEESRMQLLKSQSYQKMLTK